MEKMLGVIVSVGAFVVLVSAAVARMEHGSGREMHATTGQAGKADHHDMIKNHMGQTGHAMENHADQASRESHSGKTAQE